MNSSPLPTIDEIDEITGFLPIFSSSGFKPIRTWIGSDIYADGSLAAPYPNYETVVTQFFLIAAKACWSDYAYNPTIAAKTLEDGSLVQDCSLNEIKSLLTYCVRGERFGEGFWGEMIKRGYIQLILERLVEIKKSVI